MFSSYTDTSYDEAIMVMLGDLDIPIILDADIGYKESQLVMINGVIATIHSSRGKGEVIYKPLHSILECNVLYSFTVSFTNICVISFVLSFFQAMTNPLLVFSNGLQHKC